VRSQNPAVYKQLVDDCKYSIARAIVGQTLTSYGNEGGKGSNALGSVHAKMFYLKEVEVAIKLQTVLNDQMVRPLHLWNFGPGVPVPKLLISTEDEQDLVKRIGIDSTAQGMGVPITKKYMQETYGFTEPGPNDEIISPVQGDSGSAISGGAAQVPDFSEASHNEKEVRQLLDAMKLQLGDIYSSRVQDIAAMVQSGGAQ
jgi:phage gp29-like protein